MPDLTPGTSGSTEAYRSLLAMSQQQREALASADVDGYLALSDRREDLFGRVQALEHAVPSLDAGGRKTIRELIAAILASDQEIEGLLEEFSAAARTELTTLHQGLNALSSYATESATESFFIDQSS